MQVFGKDFFNNSTKDQIVDWIDKYKITLVGSAIFTKNNSLTSKVVRWAEGWGKKDKTFVPSHTGSIVKYDGEIYIFDMKPPKASVQPLLDYILSTKDDYRIVIRNFNLDVFMFCKNIIDHIDQWYPFMSAIRSVFTKRETKWKTHCSELHIRELQKQGLFKDINPECTPYELYEYFKKATGSN